ncbi:MAG: hypothetical protein R3C32_15165 [Chloroflexota bacterium]
MRHTGRLRGERAIGVDQTNESAVGTSAVSSIVEPAPRDLSVPDLQAHLAAIGFEGVPAPIGTLDWSDADGRVATASVATRSPMPPMADWCVEDVLAHVLHMPDGCDGRCDGLLLAGRLGARRRGAGRRARHTLGGHPRARRARGPRDGRRVARIGDPGARRGARDARW